MKSNHLTFIDNLIWKYQDRSVANSREHISWVVMNFTLIKNSKVLVRIKLSYLSHLVFLSSLGFPCPLTFGPDIGPIHCKVFLKL